jgi:hypothetical protein
MKNSTDSRYLPPILGSIVIILIILGGLISILFFIYLIIPEISQNILYPIGSMIEKAAAGEYPNSDIIVTLISIFFTFILGSVINNWYSMRIQLTAKRFDAKKDIIDSLNRYALALTNPTLKGSDRNQLLAELKVYQNLTLVYFKKNVTECLANYIFNPGIDEYRDLMEALKGSQ